MNRVQLLIVSSCMGMAVIVAGCKASFPTGTVENSLEQICEKEYKVKVKVQSTGKTIHALVVTPNALQSDLTFSDHALNKLENVMLTASRVALSSEYSYDFFVVTIMDTTTGVAVTFVRYIKDVRRLISDDISRNDYFQRLVIEVKMGLEAYVSDPGLFHEYLFPDFLSTQIAERLRSEFQSNLVVERLFQIQTISGQFARATPADSTGVFRIKVFFAPPAPDFSVVATKNLRENFLKVVFDSAKQVIRRYDFNDYQGLEIADQNDRRLAYYDRQEFSQSSMNTLMDLIQKIKTKGK